MISTRDLSKIARARLRDSEILFSNKRYDGAVYLCGYAIELALKLKICKALKWSGFPEEKRGFSSFSSFKTHDLDVLLKLSGVESKIRSLHLVDWSIIANWEPGVRYKPTGSSRKIDAENMLSSSRNILQALGMKWTI